jgi:hypothetical protein
MWINYNQDIIIKDVCDKIQTLTTIKTKNRKTQCLKKEKQKQRKEKVITMYH